MTSTGPTTETLAHERTSLSRTRTALAAATLAAASLHAGASEEDVLLALAALAWSVFALALLRPASARRLPRDRQWVSARTSAAAATAASILTLAATLC